MMKIIDAHIHFSTSHHFNETAAAAGHENTVPHLSRVLRELQIVRTVVMGSGGKTPDDGISHALGPDLAGPVDVVDYNQPSFVAYCCGVDSATLTPRNVTASLADFERHLRCPACVGIKLYPGYNYFYPDDELYYSFYELAAVYDVPVVFHTGDTASSRALVKYSHPLQVDAVAVKFPQTTFVMAHYGNPWLVDATEVLAKNPNVFADLSGLATGHFDIESFCETYRAYLDQLRCWLAYLSDYEKVMYGSDWPLVNLYNYVELLRRVIPARHHESVFYRNARRIYRKLDALPEE
ncbi:amidohydrolase family protein [Victivallis sp. Marseille-Q1083]|uniref:amidohydrolase family protein n=1 Tax=Victivallis sp. Marseille-Q1083 TaxID=2717288 RepID=UPI001C37727F|nr:amidohydrolase family protein [Victivallis sp. Marseille-Q1083]